MIKIKLSVSDTQGKAKSLEVEGPNAQIFISKKIGDELDGAVVGLQNSKIKITGGSDKDGFPMRSDVHGGIRKLLLVSDGVGFRSQHKGERRRKTIRGNTITDDIAQISLKIMPEQTKQP